MWIRRYKSSSLTDNQGHLPPSAGSTGLMSGDLDYVSISGRTSISPPRTRGTNFRTKRNGSSCAMSPHRSDPWAGRPKPSRPKSLTISVTRISLISSKSVRLILPFLTSRQMRQPGAMNRNSIPRSKRTPQHRWKAKPWHYPLETPDFSSPISLRRVLPRPTLFDTWCPDMLLNDMVPSSTEALTVR